MKTHPTKLIVLFPMHEARHYRHRLTAVDDTLVVHHRGDGSFQFELRALTKFTPRGYAKYLIELAADLEAGYRIVIVDRDIFLRDLEALAYANAAASNRDLVERASLVVAERTRYQIRDHAEGDDQHRVGRMIIAARTRRTKPGRYAQNGLNFINGIPTPRSEQLWHSLCSEWCDVRTAQQGRAAWERWVTRNRPDMPVSGAAIDFE
ncbi:conserved hypothetical protein [Sphingomonas sp. EC-HK361]|uniref:hypothetical protein n=1 Tax=Sphingomonas sp. EC-HK361 TaxID=2038397 RepID=UPI00125258AC|nr:hypothetical protein [Sphingomonas sp. EC-HK361]VVT21878.1 conserved hypothetical protein [Sphingomonas sp. EC-HK361]